MGDALGKLEAEAEALRGQFPPTLDGFRTRQGVEGGVALNSVEDGGVAAGNLRISPLLERGFLANPYWPIPDSRGN